MGTMLEKFKEVAERNSEQIKKLREESAALVKPLLQQFITDFPEVRQVRWTQYSPYFNDGEACVFSLHTFGFYFEGDDLDDSVYEHEIYRYEDFDKKEVCSPETFSACCELERQLRQVEGELESLFGDHAQVTVTADGVDVEEYDHD